MVEGVETLGLQVASEITWSHAAWAWEASPKAGLGSGRASIDLKVLALMKASFSLSHIWPLGAVVRFVLPFEEI